MKKKGKYLVIVQHQSLDCLYRHMTLMIRPPINISTPPCKEMAVKKTLPHTPSGMAVRLELLAMVSL